VLAEEMQPQEEPVAARLILLRFVIFLAIPEANGVPQESLEALLKAGPIISR
jgi:hypothetical protein